MNNLVNISILVPVCNVEKYLRKCLGSIITQSLQNIEIICINDGSKDSSLKIMKEFAEKDSRIVVVDKVNTGYGDSMNWVYVLLRVSILALFVNGKRIKLSLGAKSPIRYRIDLGLMA